MSFIGTKEQTTDSLIVVLTIKNNCTRVQAGLEITAIVAVAIAILVVIVALIAVIVLWLVFRSHIAMTFTPLGASK